VQYGISESGTIHNVNSLAAFKAFDRPAAVQQARRHYMNFCVQQVHSQPCHHKPIDVHMILVCVSEHRLRGRSGNQSSAARL